MELSLILKAGLIFFLLIFSGFFSGSETALFSLTLIQRERIKKKHKKKARILNRLLSDPRKLIVTILMGNDLVNITASVVAAYFFVSLFAEKGEWIALVVMTPMTLIFAEVIPKTLAVAYNEKVAPFISTYLDFFSKIISPIRWIFDKTAGLLIRMLGMEKQTPNMTIREDEFLDMVDSSHKDGEIKSVEKDIIHNVFEFTDTCLSDVMVPMDKVFSLPHNMEGGELVKQIKTNQYSRIPVYKDDPENITGILYVKDLLKLRHAKYFGKPNLADRVSREPFFIRDDKKTDEIFYKLKQRRIHIAICLDENGKVSGIVTLEDLLEELFGEIYDEHDKEGK